MEESRGACARGLASNRRKLAVTLAEKGLLPFFCSSCTMSTR